MTTIRDLTIFILIIAIALLAFTGVNILPQMTTIITHAATTIIR